MLDAVAALPKIEAALKKLPKDEREQGFYKTAVGRAIENLRKVKKSGDKRSARRRDKRWRASGVSPMVLLLLGFEAGDRKVKSQTN